MWHFSRCRALRTRRKPDLRKRGIMKPNVQARLARRRDEGDMGEDGEDAKAAAARRSLALLNAQADAFAPSSPACAATSPRPRTS
jgi:hypothetical protein